MQDKLAGAIYNSVKEKNEVRVLERWHSSSMAECPRAHYFMRLGVPRQSIPGAGKMLRWNAGHLFEEALRPHLESIYPDLDSNTRLTSETMDLTGEYDNYSEKEETIIEVKTVHDWAFAYRKKDDYRFDLKDGKPYINHVLQNHCYVKLLRENGKPVAFITYVYITLDGRIATYKTSVDPKVLNEVEWRLKVLETAWRTKTPPDCICNDKHDLWKSTMQYCDYATGKECCSLQLINNNSDGSDDPDWNEV